MANDASSKDIDVVSGENDAPGEMIWPQPSFDEVAKIPLQKHPRFVKKKRVHSSSFSHSEFNGQSLECPSEACELAVTLDRTHVGITRIPFAKNSRKSRDGRKISHKRGGKSLQDPTDILDELELDHDDPDYDSDEQDPAVIDTIKTSISDEELERVFPVLLREFYVHGKTQEVVDAVIELNLSPHQRRYLPYWAITSALQQKKTQCELTSELLSDLCGPVLNQAHIQQGIQMILYELGELVIDFPNAVEPIGRFIARALADDILPPKFIDYQKSALTKTCRSVSGDHENGKCLSGSPPTSAPIIVSASPDLTSSSLMGSADTRASSGFVSETSLTPIQPQLALSALTRAETLLNLSRAFARLDNIWGIPAGPKATSALVVKVRRLLAQYFDSADVDEARMTLSELDCPHFHHELVYQCIIKFIEASTDKAHQLSVSLLGELCHSAEVTADQLVLGVRRVYAELPDLQLDVPAAYSLMDRFVKSGISGHFVPKRVAMELRTKTAVAICKFASRVIDDDPTLLPLSSRLSFLLWLTPQISILIQLGLLLVQLLRMSWSLHTGHGICRGVFKICYRPRKRIVSETEVAYMSDLASGLF